MYIYIYISIQTQGFVWRSKILITKVMALNCISFYYDIFSTSKLFNFLS